MAWSAVWQLAPAVVLFIMAVIATVLLCTRVHAGKMMHGEQFTQDLPEYLTDEPCFEQGGGCLTKVKKLARSPHNNADTVACYIDMTDEVVAGDACTTPATPGACCTSLASGGSSNSNGVRDASVQSIPTNSYTTDKKNVCRVVLDRSTLQQNTALKNTLQSRSQHCQVAYDTPMVKSADARVGARFREVYWGARPADQQSRTREIAGSSLVDSSGNPLPNYMGCLMQCAKDPTCQAVHYKTIKEDTASNNRNSVTCSLYSRRVEPASDASLPLNTPSSSSPTLNVMAYKNPEPSCPTDYTRNWTDPRFDEFVYGHQVAMSAPSQLPQESSTGAHRSVQACADACVNYQGSQCDSFFFMPATNGSSSNVCVLSKYAHNVFPNKLTGEAAAAGTVAANRIKHCGGDRNSNLPSERLDDNIWSDPRFHDFMFNDLPSLHTSISSNVVLAEDAAQCARQCASREEANCKAVSWNPGTNTCTISRMEYTKRPNRRLSGARQAGAITANRRPLFKDTRYQDFSYDTVTAVHADNQLASLSNMTVADCAEKCSTDSNCLSFFHNAVERTCTLSTTFLDQGGNIHPVRNETNPGSTAANKRACSTVTNPLPDDFDQFETGALRARAGGVQYIQPEGVSLRRCMEYCRNNDGCKAIGFVSRASGDGACTFYTARYKASADSQESDLVAPVHGPGYRANKRQFAPNIGYATPFPDVFENGQLRAATATNAINAISTTTDTPTECLRKCKESATCKAVHIKELPYEVASDRCRMFNTRITTFSNAPTGEFHQVFNKVVDRREAGSSTAWHRVNADLVPQEIGAISNANTAADCMSQCASNPMCDLVSYSITNISTGTIQDGTCKLMTWKKNSTTTDTDTEAYIKGRSIGSMGGPFVSLAFNTDGKVIVNRTDKPNSEEAKSQLSTADDDLLIWKGPGSETVQFIRSEPNTRGPRAYTSIKKSSFIRA